MSTVIDSHKNGKSPRRISNLDFHGGNFCIHCTGVTMKAAMHMTTPDVFKKAVV